MDGLEVGRSADALYRDATCTALAAAFDLIAATYPQRHNRTWSLRSHQARRPVQGTRSSAPSPRRGASLGSIQKVKLQKPR